MRLPTRRFLHHPAFRVGNGGPDGSEQERGADSNVFERLPHDARFERREVGGDVR